MINNSILQRVSIDSYSSPFPRPSVCDAIKCILQTLAALLVISTTFDVKQFAPMVISTIFEIKRVNLLKAVLLISFWQCNAAARKRENGLSAKLDQELAVGRQLRSSKALEQDSLQILFQKQRVLFHNWLNMFNKASLVCLLGNAASSTYASSSNYYLQFFTAMLLLTSILLFFRAGWWLYQVDNVYLKHVIDKGKKSDLGKRLINTCVWWRRNLMLLGLDGWCLYPAKLLSKSDYVKRSPLPRRMRRKRRKLYGQLDHLDDGDIYHLHILSLSRRIQDERVHRSHKCNRSHKYCWGVVDLDELSYMVDLHAPPVKVRERKGVPIDDLLNELFQSPGGPGETFNQRSEARRNTSSARGRRRSNNLLRLPIRALLLITPILLPTVSAAPAINQSFSPDPSFVAPTIAVVGGAATALSSYTNRPTENQTLPPVHARSQTQTSSLSSKELSAFWYAIDSYVEDKKKTKSKVIKDLETKLEMSQRSLQRYFDAATHKRWNWNVIEQLLSHEKHPMWSDEWKKAVDLISRSEFGPPVTEIESYFREHHAEYPQQTTAVSPASVSTHSPTAFSHSEVDIDDMEQFLFSEDGILNPTVAELIMCNLSRDTPLSKKEDGLRTALQRKWGEDNDVQSNNQVKFRREMACLTLRPKSRKQDRTNSSSWTSVEDATVDRRRMREDAQDLQAVLETISRFDLVRAAHAIASVLRTNKVLQETVYDLTYSDESESLPKQILDGIKECLSHHTISTGTRPKESEYLVKHLLLGCVFKLLDTVSTNKIKNLLGTTAEEVNQAIDHAKLLRESGEQVQAYTRKKRKDYIRDILKKYIFRFLEDDDYTRLDTNQKPTRQVNPLLDTDEKVDVTSRIWLIPTLLDRYRYFLESKYYEEFKADHDGASVGFTIFREVLSEVGKFVSEQTERSCVDDVISNTEWAMRAMKKLISLEEVRQQLESCPCNHDGLQHADFMKMLNGASYRHVVKGVCCPEHVYEDQPKDEEGKYLKTTQKKCAYGKCQNCGVAKKLDGLLNQLEEMEGIPEVVEVLRWEKAARQGTDDKGNQNSQLELTSTQMEIKDFIQHFKDCTNECIPHYHRIKWIGWDLKHDYNALPADEGFILTDFGATTNLKATEKVNSATDAHLACCNFVVLTNRRTVKVNKQLEDGSFEEEDVIVYDVKYFHFLAGTLTKGKKADWRMHQVCLDKILEIMNREDGITKFKYWTDNAPHQYKCRQTFISDASIADRHPLIKLIHKFAVVAQFKGPHDASGKWIGATLTLLEKCFVRNPTAYEAFKHLNEYLVQNKDKAKDWKKLEADRNPALKNKGVFGMDERNVFFVGETQEEVDQMKEKDPELAHLMLVCDRTHTISAEEALYNTAQIQYIRSIQTTKSQKSPREHSAIVSTEGCKCKDCLVDPLNNVCIHAEHRNTREVILKATDPSPEEIPQYIDSKVIVTYRNGKNKANADKIGRIIGYENTTKKPGGKNEWKFRVTLDQDVDEFEDDGSQCDEYLHYDEASYSRNRYVEFVKQNELPISDWAAANPHFIKCAECNCNNKAQATCTNHMCKDCCMGEMAAIPCTLVSHNCTEDTATSSNQATPSNQAKPSDDYEDLLKLKPELPAVIKSYTENKIIPTIKQLRAILLFYYDANTQKSRLKQFYVDKLEGLYEDDPEKLTDPEKLANALSNLSALSST